MTLINHMPARCGATAGRNGHGPAAFRVGCANWMTVSVATVLLVALTGLPARSVPNLLPHSDDQAGPHIGF